MNMIKKKKKKRTNQPASKRKQKLELCMRAGSLLETEQTLCATELVLLGQQQSKLSSQAVIPSLKVDPCGLE